MLLWVGFAVLTAAVVAALLRPLLAVREADATPPAASAAVYRDQLSEIEAEHARGLIGDAEAEAARVEIARRLLATAEPESHLAKQAPRSASLATVAMSVAAALPVLAIATYLAIGAPNMPGLPHASRVAPPGSPPAVAELVAKVEARLREQPEDGRGWDVIAPVYLRLGRYAEASDAFSRALRLLGESPERLAGLAESHVLANDGVVTETARTSYVRLQELAPERVEPRFWLAVAAEQDGRFEEAAASYEKLLTEGDASAAWRPTVVERWRAARTRLGQATEPIPAGKATAVAPKLAKEDVDAAQAMSPEARKQMIEGMVAGLDQRLSQNGRDLEGWQRLIRAYVVLGRREEALGALGRARAALAEEAQSLEVLGVFAKSLGLAS